MNIRKATIDEVDEIKSIYRLAKSFMNENGNSSQWVKDYPKRELLIKDIEKGELYVCENEGKISAVFCFFIGNEPTYDNIFDGKWLNNDEYGVIHRIAVVEHHKGIASFCIQWCLKICPNMRIDTHKNNIPMQKTILKNGFQYCGIIKKEDGSERLAYQICN